MQIAPTNPVPPNMVRFNRLKTEGRLAKGDELETAQHGKCEVAYFKSVENVVVRTQEGSYVSLTIEGFRERARLVEH